MNGHDELKIIRYNLPTAMAMALAMTTALALATATATAAATGVSCVTFFWEKGGKGGSIFFMSAPPNHGCVAVERAHHGFVLR